MEAASQKRSVVFTKAERYFERRGWVSTRGIEVDGYHVGTVDALWNCTGLSAKINGYAVSIALGVDIQIRKFHAADYATGARGALAAARAFVRAQAALSA